MSTLPLVSIVIANYENVDYFEESIRSAYCQSYSNIEIIVVEDGSSKVIKDYVKQKTSQYGGLYVDLPKNCGLAHARNEGIVSSSGEWLLMLDSDDLLPVWAVEKLIANVQSGDWMVSGWLLSVPQNFKQRANLLRILKCAFFSRYYRENFRRIFNFLSFKKSQKPWRCFGNTSTLYSRKVFQVFGLYDEDLIWAEDTEFKRRLIHVGKLEPHRCNIISYLYRMHQYQMTKSKIKPDHINALIDQRIKMRCEEGINSTNTRILI